MIRHEGRIEYPNELDVVVTHDYDAPIQLVYDVMTKEKHVRNTIAPFGETVTACTFDVRVGGGYHYVFVTEDGYECSFRGTFLEVEPPHRTVETWIFDGWPDVEAVETIELVERDGVTRLTWTLHFPDLASRAHMKGSDGVLANFDNVQDYLETLVAT